MLRRRGLRFLRVFRWTGYVRTSPLRSKYTGITMTQPEETVIEEDVELTLVEDPENGVLPDVVAETQMLESSIETEETHWTIAIQVFIPFLIAGFGMVGAGLVLGHVQHWPVFLDITEMLILVTPLLGLKGNLEMTLASRLSTQANLGNMDAPKEQWSMIVGNLTLIQCQAIVVGFLSSLVAVVISVFKGRILGLDDAFLLCASSLVTASVASFVLGLITAAVIVFSRHCNINPDNVATPIAASLGDITSLALLSWVSTMLYDAIGKQDWVAPLIISGYILVIPLWVWIAKKNKHTREVLYTGWLSVILAMLVSSVGGIILDLMSEKFRKLAVFQPVINGVGGNLVAVQASRISTTLHRDSEFGSLSPDTVICITPMTGFFGKGIHARTTQVLMAMVIPGQLIFIYAIDYIKNGQITLTPLFITVYLLAAVLQVGILLYSAYVMVHGMWKSKIDPDNSAIPCLTAMGDLIGSSLLAIAFLFLHLVGDPYGVKDQ
ncbi:solute carrier family 41 member 1-like isoform X2 [Ischnura elegans]|uniref:solute carrier family 41 member 1-like isoform X2 n=1 Tax=Ischnura elegans TaxID=197161 RepID=UPI001ED8BCA1|nr:solute carrier family 41 member 1-like isoform X2 [Ischnura elegans]